MTVDRELKRKISQRWHILAGVKREDPEAAAFAQLEYILTEAGLLAKRRKRHEFGKIPPGDHDLAPDEARDAYINEATSFPRDAQ